MGPGIHWENHVVGPTKCLLETLARLDSTLCNRRLLAAAVCAPYPRARFPVRYGLRAELLTLKSTAALIYPKKKRSRTRSANPVPSWPLCHLLFPMGSWSLFSPSRGPSKYEPGGKSRVLAATRRWQCCAPKPLCPAQAEPSLAGHRADLNVNGLAH